MSLFSFFDKLDENIKKVTGIIDGLENKIEELTESPDTIVKKKKKKSRLGTIPIISDPFDPDRCSCQIDLTPEIFKQVMNLKINKLFGGYNMDKSYETYKLDIQLFLDKMNEMWDKHNINNCRRRAHYLGQIWLETDNFNTLLEYSDGTQYNPSKRKDAKDHGNTEDGDGPKYRGRGCIQLTWKNNYAAYSKYLIDNNLSTDDLKTNYELVTSNPYHSLHSSGWFWEFGISKNNGDIINLNNLSDQLLTDRISTLVNGGRNGRAERKRITENTLTFFNYKKCINYHK